MRPNPSEVWTFKSPTAPKGELKPKHHLCIGSDAIFLFVSTHHEWRTVRPGVMIIPNSEVPFLPQTESQQSEISCTMVIQREFPDPTVSRKNLRGSVKRRLMKDLLEYVRKSRQIAEDDRDAILDAIYDYYGTALG